MSDRIIINRIEIENLGRIKKLFCDSLSGINLIIGENGSGKTFLLKALYSAIRTTEEPESVKLSKVQNGKQDLKTQRPKRCFC